MKSIIVSMIAAAGLMVAGSAFAVDMPDLAKKNNCTACHAIDKKLVGPAWQAVADKYKGDASAKAKLVTKTMTGGRPGHPAPAVEDQPARSAAAKGACS